MIPRLKPYLGKEELLAALSRQKNAVNHFEKAFAETFEARYALAFPYGRCGLWAFFKTMGLEQIEVIMPAYTCVVVAHAIVLSNNFPRFVDITLYDYNMDFDQVEVAITERTRAVIATHLFGYPLAVGRLSEIVQAAEQRYGHKIWVIQDCAHDFGARWEGKLVCNEDDAALFGMNISKMITSVFGGIITTNDSELYEQLKTLRGEHFLPAGIIKSIRRFCYLLAVYSAFNENLYGLINWLERETALLDGLTRAYHLDGLIHFPSDHLDQLSDLEARVGLVQLQKYRKIIHSRKIIASYYDKQLQGMRGLTLPPIVEGASYSHYVARVTEREATISTLRSRGIEIGRLIDYSIPHLKAYQQYAEDLDCFPNSLICSRTTINLPVHSSLTEAKVALIASAIKDLFRA